MHDNKNGNFIDILYIGYIPSQSFFAIAVTKELYYIIRVCVVCTAILEYLLTSVTAILEWLRSYMWVVLCHNILIGFMHKLLLLSRKTNYQTNI